MPTVNGAISFYVISAYPNTFHTFQVTNYTNSSLSMSGWRNLTQLGRLPPIYLIECVSPSDACKAKLSTSRIKESSNLAFTYTDLLPNINYTFRICIHNGMSITYIQSHYGPKVKCHDKTTLTKEGCKIHKIFFIIFCSAEHVFPKSLTYLPTYIKEIRRSSPHLFTNVEM